MLVPIRWLSVVSLFWLLVLGASVALAAPKSDLWDRWTAHTPGSVESVDHVVWAGLLKRHSSLDSNGIVRLNYDRMVGAERQALDRYLALLASVNPDRLDRPEQMAYWFNMYNALTVQVILDHWPVDTIRDIDISPGLFANGPWGAKLITVAGERLSLDDIEHRILRPIWRDPRIHYGVNCAALGCPNLVGAFTSLETDAMLDGAARAFVNHPRGVTVRDGSLRVSSIYRWFKEDFGDSDAGVIAHLREYAEPDLLAALEGITRISGTDYDWDINAARGAGVN